MKHESFTKLVNLNLSAVNLHTVIQQANIFQTMFEELPVAIALADENGCIVYSNKKFCLLTGCPQEELKSSLIDEIIGTDEDGKGISRLFLESREQECKYSNWYLNSGTEKVSICLSVNKLSQYICYTATENARELETLTQRNIELDRSNQELSQYAYVASHDLQEPLRKIRIFSDMLGSSEKIQAKDRFIAQKINKAAERMNRLILDLLNYSKLVKPDAELEMVDLQQVLQDVLNDFEITIQERKAIVQFGQLPVVNAVRLQMNQLFHNLLGNALKFTPADQSPLIEISVSRPSFSTIRKYYQKAQPDSKYLMISFRDHGMGFEKKDAEKIFEVFKRLYTGQRIQGSGIGLALCRRIVQNKGGSLFADSKPGKGSVFNIILPESAFPEPVSVDTTG